MRTWPAGAKRSCSRSWGRPPKTPWRRWGGTHCAQGVLKYFTDLNSSLMERLQRSYPEARFVKAFNCVGSARMVDPDFGGTRPTMFYCGDDADAKATVARVLDQFGWDIEDMGGAIGARAIEPLAMLWCIPGFLRDSWGHALHLLR